MLKSEAEKVKNALSRKINREDYNNITQMIEFSAETTFSDTRSRHNEKFNQLRGKTQQEDEVNKQKWVVNNSSCELTDAEERVLK